jgi:hypothetical protein
MSILEALHVAVVHLYSSEGFIILFLNIIITRTTSRCFVACQHIHFTLRFAVSNYLM